MDVTATDEEGWEPFQFQEKRETAQGGRHVQSMPFDICIPSFWKILEGRVR